MGAGLSADEEKKLYQPYEFVTYKIYRNKSSSFAAYAGSCLFTYIVS
jgi:hypothetical protein